jgi:hypothetical protein
MRVDSDDGQDHKEDGNLYRISGEFHRFLMQASQLACLSGKIFIGVDSILCAADCRSSAGH